MDMCRAVHARRYRPSSLLGVLVAAAFCPHPPVILPEVGAGASADLEPLREACAEAIGAMIRAQVQRVVIVGAAERTQWFGAAAAGDFTGFGVDVAAGWGDAGVDPDPLPLSLAVGAWLLARCDHGLPVSGLAVAHDTDPDGCRALSRELPADRYGLLVMGDGSARRETESPGYLDERAVAFDQCVTRLLAAADVDGLLALDPRLAADLLVAGRAPWQVAAAAVTQPVRADVLYDDAPYGVGYFVAGWETE